MEDKRKKKKKVVGSGVGVSTLRKERGTKRLNKLVTGLCLRHTFLLYTL